MHFVLQRWAWRSRAGSDASERGNAVVHPGAHCLEFDRSHYLLEGSVRARAISTRNAEVPPQKESPSASAGLKISRASDASVEMQELLSAVSNPR